MLQPKVMGLCPTLKRILDANRLKVKESELSFVSDQALPDIEASMGWISELFWPESASFCPPGGIPPGGMKHRLSGEILGFQHRGLPWAKGPGEPSSGDLPSGFAEPVVVCEGRKLPTANTSQK